MISESAAGDAPRAYIKRRTVGAIMGPMEIPDLPAAKGAVDRLLFNASGNIQGFVLASGLEVYLPLHLADAIRAAAHAITGTHGEMRRDSTCDWCGPR